MGCVKKSSVIWWLEIRGSFLVRCRTFYGIRREMALGVRPSAFGPRRWAFGVGRSALALMEVRPLVVTRRAALPITAE
jgi:hypothetical protein